MRVRVAKDVREPARCPLSQRDLQAVVGGKVVVLLTLHLPERREFGGERLGACVDNDDANAVTEERSTQDAKLSRCPGDSRIPPPGTESANQLLLVQVS